jgi:hypothetical protein
LNLTEEQQRAEKLRLERIFAELNNLVGVQSDNFRLELTNLQKQKVPVTVQADLARRKFGLIREAYRLLDEAGGNLDPIGVAMLIEISLALGQPEEARDRLLQVPEQARGQFLRLQNRVWIALGDYARAGKGIEEEIAQLEREIDPKARYRAYAAVLQNLHFSNLEQAAQITRLGTLIEGMAAYANVSTAVASIDLGRASLHVTRALLALEEGDLMTARTHFKSALAVPVDFPGADYAQMYLYFLEQYAPPK